MKGGGGAKKATSTTKKASTPTRDAKTDAVEKAPADTDINPPTQNPVGSKYPRSAKANVNLARTAIARVEEAEKLLADRKAEAKALVDDAITAADNDPDYDEDTDDLQAYQADADND